MTIRAGLLIFFILIGGMSHAVSLNSRGIGEVLLFPYYTVNGGTDTLITLVNTTDQVKSLTIRFKESRNSRDVLSFNIYLAPQDTWAAVVTSAGSESPARILTNDPTCTVPSVSEFLDQGGVAFRPFAFTGEDADGAGSSDQRTREGFIEVYELGEVAFDLADGQVGDELGDYAVFVDDTPQDCDRLADAWRPGGQWEIDPNVDMRSPSGGLYGNAMLINVLGGYQASYDAEALVGFYQPTSAMPQSLQSEIGGPEPSLSSAISGSGPVAIHLIDADGEPLTATFGRAVDAISALLMTTTLSNDYAVDSALDAATNWIVTLPTRQYYVEPDAVSAPFTVMQQAETGPGLGDAKGAEPVDLIVANRDSSILGQRPPISIPPSQETQRELLYASNIFAFNRGDGAPTDGTLLGSRDHQIVDLADPSALFENGSGMLRFSADGQRLVSLEGIVFRGLPVLGLSVQVVRNGTLTDSQGQLVRSNYAGAVKHRGSVQIQRLAQ